MPKISEYQALLFRSLPIIKEGNVQAKKKKKKKKKKVKKDKKEKFWMIFFKQRLTKINIGPF